MDKGRTYYASHYHMLPPPQGPPEFFLKNGCVIKKTVVNLCIVIPSPSRSTPTWSLMTARCLSVALRRECYSYSASSIDHWRRTRYVITCLYYKPIPTQTKPNIDGKSELSLTVESQTSIAKNINLVVWFGIATRISGF